MQEEICRPFPPEESPVNISWIQYPEVICPICFMEFNTVMAQKAAHQCKHNKYIPASTAAPSLHHYTFATNIMTSTG